MKNFQSTIENEWVEAKSIVLTPEQEVLLNSESPADEEAKKELINTLNNASRVAPTTEDGLICQESYVSHKPALKAGDEYQLISVDLSIADGVANGIINCRVNNEHKQARF